MNRKSKKIVKIIISFIIAYLIIFFTELNPLSCQIISLNQMIGWFGVSIFVSLVGFGDNLLKILDIDPWANTEGQRSEFRRKIAISRIFSVKYWFLNIITNIIIAILVFLLILALNYINSLGC